MASGSVDEIKDRIGIIDIITPVVHLKKAGRNFQGLCPFHSEKTPSFVVFPDKGNYHCFGCGANGDIFTFLMKTQNIEFGEALAQLAQRAGVSLPEHRGSVGQKDKRERIFEVNAAAAEYYHDLLVKSELASTARTFLTQRGLKADTVHRFQLGYSPDSWDTTSGFLIKQGYAESELLAAGLLVERDNGGYYDRFRGRLMFPIRDTKERIVGFGARTLDNGVPKFLNSPDTEVFEKGSNLYGIDQAASAIRQHDKVVVVEGYMDVLIGHQSGIQYMVAALGTALTDRHVSLLKKLTRNVILALDPDSAGDDATLRGLDVMRESFGDKVVPVTDSRGMIRLEARLGADIRVMNLPRGKDPDELLLENPDEWTRRQDTAKPVVDYYFDVLLKDLDLNSAKGKSTAVERLRPIIRELDDRVQQWHYIQELAHRLHVNEEVVATAIGRSDRHLGSKQRRTQAPQAGGPVMPRKGLSMEEYCLVMLLQNPALVRHPGCIEPEVLRDPLGREVLRTLGVRVATGEPFTIEDFKLNLNELLREFLSDVDKRAALLPELPASDLEGEATSVFFELRRQSIRERIKELEDLTRDAEDNGDKDAAREFHSKAEELLAQLESYERGKARAWVWK